MRRALELTGQRFGWLTVLGRAENTEDGHSTWECQCACGQKKMAVGFLLTRGQVKSCGCRQRMWRQHYMKRYRFSEHEMFDFIRTAEELPDYQTAWVSE